MNKDIYASVFDRIITEMEHGNTPWVKPWRSLGRADALPYNAVTGREYSGGNVFALWFAGLPYTSSGWLTFKQAISAGCVVRKGEKGTPVYYMSVADSKQPTDDDKKPNRYFFAKGFTVFNLDQLDELEPGKLAALKTKHLDDNTFAAPVGELARVATADAFVRGTGADIRHGGDRACFIPSLDLIKMPEPGTFSAPDTYYGTLFHELTHWTGHESRLNRITPAAFGSADYAFEELVAELGAALLSALHGMDTVTQSAAYLRSWAKACRQSPDMFARAASYAQKAIDSMAHADDAAELIAS